MTMVADRLPPSNTISVFNIFLIHQLLSSIVITFAVVLSIKLYYTEEDSTDVGYFHKFVVCLYTFSLERCSRKEEHIAPVENSSKRTKASISWRKVSQFYDTTCFRFICVSFGIQLCIYVFTFLFK